MNNQQTSARSDYRYTNGFLTGTVKYSLGSMVYKDSIVYNNEGFEEAYLQRQLSANNMIKERIID